MSDFKGEKIPETERIYLDDAFKSEALETETNFLESETRTKVLYLIRDGEQSSLVDKEWVFNSTKLSEACIKAAESGFSAIEIGGGRSLEMALTQGHNIFKILKTVRKNLDEAGFPNVHLQVLARGANGMGFEYQDPSVVEALIEEHEKSGITIVRTFDALNDIDNINFYGTLHNQGAIAYDRDYSVNHYLEFAKKLKEKGAQSFCIKDMGGQLKEETLAELYSGLKKLGLKTTLHMHSTDEEKSFKVISKAISLGIDGIEVAPFTLDGGASHHKIEKFLTDDALKNQLQEINEENLEALNVYVSEIFKDKKRQNLETLFPEMEEEERKDILQKFCKAGIPGGAIPSVLNDLAIFGEINLKENLKLYFEEIKLVKIDAGNPPLVTPSADIISKQAIFNIMYQKSQGTSENISTRYGRIEPSFAKLILGHYGRVNNYETGAINTPESQLIDIVNEKYPDLENLTEKNIHPSEKTDYRTMDDYLEKVQDYKSRLTKRFKNITGKENLELGEEISQIILDSFGTERQIALAVAMPPKGPQKQAKNKKGQKYIEYMIECRQMKFTNYLGKIIKNILNVMNCDLSTDVITQFEALKNYSGSILEGAEFSQFGIRNKEDAKNIILKSFWLLTEKGFLPKTSTDEENYGVKKGTGFKPKQAEVINISAHFPKKPGLNPQGISH